MTVPIVVKQKGKRSTGCRAYRKCQDYVYVKYYVKMKHYSRHENKVKENIALSYCEASIYMYNTIETMKKLLSIKSNLQTHYYFKLDFKKWTNIQEANG